MSSLLTNTSAMTALQTLKGINKNLSMIQEQVSTGKKINTAKDNAGIWAVSSVMGSDVRGFKAISESLSLGQATVAVARDATETVKDLLVEMKALIVTSQRRQTPEGVPPVGRTRCPILSSRRWVSRRAACAPRGPAFAWLPRTSRMPIRPDSVASR